MRFLRLLPLAAVLVATTASAQVCTPGKDQREAKMLAFFAAPLAFSPSGVATPLAAGEVRLGLDVTYVPNPSADIRRPEKCYNNNKTENTQLSPVFPRPRVMVGLGGGFGLEASYLPPVTVMDATPNLLSLALAWGRPLAAGTSLLLRAHTTVGQVKGPIVCAPDVIQTSNPTGNCYATEASDDTYKPGIVGGEAALAFGRASRIQGYVGLGATSLKPRFQVGYTDAAHNVDTTRVEVDLTRVAAFAGAAWKVNPRVWLTGELYSVPSDVTTIRLGGSYRLRAGR